MPTLHEYCSAQAMAHFFSDYQSSRDWLEAYQLLNDCVERQVTTSLLVEWRPFEEHDYPALLQLVNEHADATELEVREVLAAVKQGLVATACESRIPLDLNDLDMPSLFERGINAQA